MNVTNDILRKVLGSKNVISLIMSFTVKTHYIPDIGCIDYIWYRAF